ncbi:uncharacterized protein JCM15063_004721 [Sporobolomyces koalae]|uniref:uncharacterized protein n=1 Tax=Sporobolomyces koalae TaxID=500713 RepID=UPI0031728CE8
MRPAFKNGGGKKGPRQVTSKYQKKIILRPAPVRDRSTDDATSTSKGKERAYDEPDDDDEDDDQDSRDHDQTEVYGYRESLLQDKLPLAGLAVSVSGCPGQKEDLLRIAEEYGAERHGGLQEDTTHVVTDKPEGAKYKIALERRMAVMQPDWLPAVREAWTSGEKVDFEQLERDYRLLPLTNVVFTMTHFAKGDYKEEFRNMLLEAGAEYTPRLDKTVTHLIVASSSAPRSQTPPSDKLLHARRNKDHLDPRFTVVWEGWAREAIEFGGRREARDKIWTYREGREEPQQDLSWTVPAPARYRKTVEEQPRASTSARTSTASKRNLSGRGFGAGEDRTGTTRQFTGYDNSILEEVADEPHRSTHDLANGKVLKKRRKGATAPDASQGVPEHLYDVFGKISDVEGAANENKIAKVQPNFDLPHPDTVGLDLPVPPPGYNDEDMVLEMREGEVGLQRTRKSKSAIKALTSKRAVTEVETAPKSISLLRTTAEDQQHMQDDSGFLETTEASLKPEQSASSNDSTQESLPDVFRGLTLAIMDVKARDPTIIAQYVEKGGGTAVIDASDEELESADWIIVDFVEPPFRFANSIDPRVVSVCWIELCIWAEQVVPVGDHVLGRPIPFACPVKGADAFKLHFSGFSGDQDPFMHHNRRYLHAVGTPISSVFDRSCTHLVLSDLESDASLSPSKLDDSGNRKLQKAREWGKVICSMRDFRQQITALAAERESNAHNEPSEKDREHRGAAGEEITNEASQAGQDVEESARGPLHDCATYFSSRIDIDRQKLANIVTDLGGTAARQFSTGITHYIYHDPPRSEGKASARLQEFHKARTMGCHIVHPRWIEECGRTGARASELDFPHTFDSRKGGQLFEAGMSMAVSPPPGDGRNSPHTARTESSEGTVDAPTRRTPLKPNRSDINSRAIAAGSPSPRRQRSDSCRTEVAADDRAQEQETTGRARTASVSPPTNPFNKSLETASRSSNFLHSTDTHPSAQPLSAIPPRQTDEDAIEKRQADAAKQREAHLKQQTDFLMMQMLQTKPVAGPAQQSLVDHSRPSSPNKKHPNPSPTRTTSLPTLLPSSSPPRMPPFDGTTGGDYLPSSSMLQHSQSQSQMGGGGGGGPMGIQVMYDNPEQIEARETIKRRLELMRQQEENASKKVGNGRGGRVETDGDSQFEKRVTRSARKSR